MFVHIGSGCTQLPPDSPSGLRFGFDLLCRRQEVTMRVRYKQATVEGSIRRWDGIGWYTMVWNVDGWQWEVLALADPQTNKQINKRLANRPRRDCRTFAQKGKTIELNWQQRTGTTGIWVGWWCRSAGSGAAARGPLTRPVMVLIALSMPQRSPVGICVQAWFHRRPICSRPLGRSCTRRKYDPCS